MDFNKKLTKENFSMQDREDLKQLCFSVIKNEKLGNYEIEKVDKTISKIFTDLVGTDKPTMRELKHPIVEYEIFKIIEETVDVKIQSGFANNTFFNQFVEMRRVADGDRIEFYIENPEAIVVSEKSRGNWDINRQRFSTGDSFTLPVRSFGARIYTEFKHLLSGRILFSEMIEKVAIGIKEKLSETIAKEFMSTFDSIPAEYKHTGTYDEAELVKIIRTVRAANGNAPAIIAGTAGALDKITGNMGTNSFLVSEDMKNQINNTGVLSVWKGNRLLEIPQVFKAGTSEFAFKDDMLFVLTGDEKPIKLIQEGNSYIREVKVPQGNQDQTIEYQVDTNWGVGIVMNKIFGAFKLQ